MFKSIVGYPVLTHTRKNLTQRILEKNPGLEKNLSTSERSQETSSQESSAPNGSNQKTSSDNGYLTQEQVNSILANERRQWKQQFDKEKASLLSELEGLKQVQEEFQAFKRLIEEAASEVTEEEKGAQGQNQQQTNNSSSSTYAPLEEFEREFTIPPGVKDRETFIRLKRQQYIQNKQVETLTNRLQETEKTLNALREQAEAERKARQQAEMARLEALRDSLITNVLTKNRCIDPEMALMVFQPRVQFDAKSGKFKYTKKDGTVTTVEEGIAEDLPPYLIQTVTSEGGAGSSGSKRPSDTEIGKLRAAVAEAEKEARTRPGDPRALQEYMRAKRKLQEALAEK